MRWPPINWTPDPETFRNGAPVRASDVLNIDRQATWTACRKWHVPVILGEHFEDGDTYEQVVNLPAFTKAVRFEFLCSGKGTITINSGDDSFNAKLTVIVGPGTSGTHSFADANWVKTNPPIDSPAANNTNRAMETAFNDSNHKDTFTWLITDESATETLRVYAVRVVPLWPPETAELTTAT